MLAHICGQGIPLHYLLPERVVLNRSKLEPRRLFLPRGPYRRFGDDLPRRGICADVAEVRENHGPLIVDRYYFTCDVISTILTYLGDERLEARYLVFVFHIMVMLNDGGDRFPGRSADGFVCKVEGALAIRNLISARTRNRGREART